MSQIKTTANKENMRVDLLSHLEVILKEARRSELNDMFLNDISKHTKVVKDVLGISELAAVFFAYFLNEHDSSSFGSSRLADFLNINNLRMMQYSYVFDELVENQLIRRRRERDGTSYLVPNMAVQAIIEGKKVEKVDYSKISSKKFFDIVFKIFNDISLHNINYLSLTQELMDLVKKTSHLSISSSILEAKPHPFELNYLFLHFHLLVNESKSEVSSDDLDEYFAFDLERKSISRALLNGDIRLLRDGWIEPVNNNGFADNTIFTLTKKGREMFLSDINLPKSKNNSKIKRHDSLPKKDLYYNQNEEEQIEQLTNLLKDDNFKNVQKRLSEKGLRNGFATLFYGAPGTGKTETVYQIAKQTGRDIFPVDISAIRSKWVGESESNIKNVFNEYRNMVKSSDIAPILLFNEADGVFGNRVEARRTVDKMENTVQNIILEELEQLNGILIATTNLTNNLDPAFERRFIYKIKFDAPDHEARKSIWTSQLPSLNNEELTYISNKYDLTGGQIENVIRKFTIDLVLKNKEPNLFTLSKFCDNEQKGFTRKSMGLKLGFV